MLTRMGLHGDYHFPVGQTVTVVPRAMRRVTAPG